MILITGGMGFIGLHTARALLDAGEQVTITRFRTTRLPPFIADAVGNGLTVIPLDLSKPDDVLAALQANRITSILHLAVPPRANLAPGAEISHSLQATLTMLDAAVAAGIRKVTIASSVAAYFSLPAGSGPFTEDMPLAMTAGHPIEADKKIDEIAASFFARSGLLDITRARIGSIWGPLYHSMMNAPSRLALRAIGREQDYAGRPDPLVAHPDDCFDFLYVKDCADGLARLHLADSGSDAAYNIAAGGMTRFADLVAAVASAVPGADLTLAVPDRAPIGDPRDFMAIDRLAALTGFAPRYGIEAAMSDYVVWLREHPQ